MVRAPRILHRKQWRKICYFNCCLKCLLAFETMFSDYYLKYMQTLAIVKGAFLPHVYRWVNVLNRFLKALVHLHVELTLLSPQTCLWSAKSVYCGNGDLKWLGWEPVHHCWGNIAVVSHHVSFNEVYKEEIQTRCSELSFSYDQCAHLFAKLGNRFTTFCSISVLA